MKAITRLREPYDDERRQADAALMGMYVFIATEIMLFGGLFLVIAWLRFAHPTEVVAASRRMHMWLGALNTAILLTSSAFVAVAVHAAEKGNLRTLRLGLFGAALLGLAFLGIKAGEYRMEYREGLLPVSGGGHTPLQAGERLFMDLYLAATGLHAVHLCIGIALIVIILLRSLTGRMPLPQRAILVTCAGLYWHLVDVIWIFLFPLLYLAR